MMHYFYHSDYHAMDHVSNQTPQLVLDVRIYALADKYFIAPLRILAYSKFKLRLGRDLNKPAFARAVREVYLTGAAQQAKFLRHIERVLVQLPELVYDHEKHYDLNLALRDNGHAATRVAMALARELESSRSSRSSKRSKRGT